MTIVVSNPPELIGYIVSIVLSMNTLARIMMDVRDNKIIIF